MRLAAITAAAVAWVAAAAVPAWAQMESREAIQLQNQILELRRQVQGLASGGGYDRAPSYPQPYQPSGGGSGLEAQLLDRVQTLEDQVRRLRGQLDEQSNTLRVAQDRLSKQLDDLNFKLGNAPAAAASQPAPSQPAPTRPTAADGGAGARRTPELALGDGNAALARRDYPAAEAAAREVLAAGRNTPRAGDANFLLAQSLVGQRNYGGAAVAYDDAYNGSRKGPRAPDALLGLANALTGLGERPAACATLDKLRGEFPSARPALRDTAAQLRARNGCT